MGVYVYSQSGIMYASRKRNCRGERSDGSTMAQSLICGGVRTTFERGAYFFLENDDITIKCEEMYRDNIFRQLIIAVCKRFSLNIYFVFS